MKILIAEDEIVSRRLLEKTLNKFGHEVISTHNGEDAWKKYKSEKISFLIVDWIMPKINGLELCKLIRLFEKSKNKKSENKIYCYIIMLTAKNQIEDIISGINAGADDFVPKPFNKRELQVRIKAGCRVLEMKNQLTKVNKKLRKIDEMKNELLVVIAHEFGTPLSILKGNVDMFLDGNFGEITDFQRKRMHLINSNIERLTKMQRQTFLLTKFDNERFELVKEKTPLNELIKEVVYKIKILAEKKNQEIDINLKDCSIYCEKKSIIEVIENLLINAIKYSGKNSNIEVNMKEENNNIHITISDDGPGIEKDHLGNIFNRFYIAHRHLNHKQGTGLGLAIVKEIIEAHDGKIWCESEYGNGCAFHFTIPISSKHDKIKKDTVGKTTYDLKDVPWDYNEKEFENNEIIKEELEKVVEKIPMEEYN